MKKVAFHTLGCKVNSYETEAMEEEFISRGYDIVREEDLADIYVINTCTVTNLADRKSRQFIRRAKKINPKSIIAVVGCYSQVAPEELEEIPDVDIIIGTTNRKDIVSLCEDFMKNKKKINVVKNIRDFKKFEDISIDDVKDRTRAYVKIQDGCNQYCSYCIIPYARGPIRSRDLKDIVSQVEKLSEAGFKELVFTGIHVSSYGKDLEDLGLIDVLKETSKVEGIERIRLSSLEPRLVSRQFLEELYETKKVCSHFHLSLQSGSNKILSLMNRRYTREEYKEIVNLIREFDPDAGITTDIIVGFPGEGEKEFKETMDFVEDIGFSRIHVFKYSKRRGTKAAKMPQQVRGDLKSKRSKDLIELGDRLGEEFARSFIGRSLKVLFEEEKTLKNHMEGYTENYIRVIVEGDMDLKGQVRDVKIIGQDGSNLIGKL